MSTLIKLADALGVTLDELCRDEVDKQVASIYILDMYAI